jgi:trehalose-6-phosphate synthase
MNSRLRNATFIGCKVVVVLSRFFGAQSESSYLVDPASSHMLVSKIKPCMSKYKQVCTVKLRMAH